MQLQRKKDLLKILLIIQRWKINKIKQNRSKKKKRLWIRPCIREREIRGEASTLVQEMRLGDLNWYCNYTRMTPNIFERLLHLVGPIIKKQETCLRQSISPTVRLLITLRYINITCI